MLCDRISNRWLVSQFAGTSTINDECIAVSVTNDATGSYYRYDAYLGSNFYDYPKLSVWPDGYYMGENVFDSGGINYLGPQPFAFDRTAMLSGNPATFITTSGPLTATLGFMLPSDLDGSILPPTGAPNPFPNTGGSLSPLYRFHVDFVNPGNSTFDVGGTLSASGYTELCPGTRACVPEVGISPSYWLDGIGDRPMFRSAYGRVSDGHEALVGNL